MATELDGTVRMRGHTGAGVPVRVVAGESRLKIVSGNELIGEWDKSDVGIVSLHEGFSIRAEGEEFILHTDDDVALAEELSIAAASPRLARKIAARHNPEERDLPADPEPVEIPSNIAAIGFALAGALIVLGGVFLNMAPDVEPATLRSPAPSGSDFWVAFVVGGVLMIGVAYVMSIGTRIARLIAVVVMLAIIGLFGWTVAATEADAGELTAYGFIAGGVVVGVAVLASGSLRSTD